MIAKVLLTGFAIAVVANSLTLAATPPGTDLSSETHGWFEQQHNVGGQPCCAVSDGHMLDDRDVRTTGGFYEVKIDDAWYPVHPDAMRDPTWGGPNPTGHPVVWYTRTITILPGLIISCFAPGTLL